MKKFTSYILLVVGALALLMVDIVTKVLAVDKLKGKPDFVIWEGVLSFSYLENTGSAFSMLEGWRWFFIVLTIGLMIFIFIWYGRIAQEKKFWLLRICALLFVAGGIGNLIDRIRHGYVVDFIYFIPIDFPKFNVADCYVVVGVILFGISIFSMKEEELQRIFAKGE